jgi:dimethylhistidine N-methyltransferase
LRRELFNLSEVDMHFATPQIRTPALSTDDFRHEFLAGLALPVKRVPCKYLYDQHGAKLFEAICELNEYYPTRTEISILRRNIREITALFGPKCALVDLGSGNSAKSRLLLQHLVAPAAYVPIDVSHAQLLCCADRLAQDYPGLVVLPVCADFTGPFHLPELPPWTQQIVLFYPGSTIGNIEPHEAGAFLRRICKLCGRQTAILVGVDLDKNPTLLRAAYNDSQGLTAAFNLNLLARANRELNANFDLSLFQHRAIYNPDARRVEMHLISCKHQSIRISGRQFRFAQGEPLITEHSYKYTVESFNKLVHSAGFNVERIWSDPNDWFSVQYLRTCQHWG